MAMITINANTAAIAAQGGIDFEAYIRGGFTTGTTGGGFPSFDNSSAFVGEEMFIGYGTTPADKYVLMHGELSYNFGFHTVAGTANTIEYGTRGSGSFDSNGYYTGGNVELTITGLDLSNPIPTSPAEEATIEATGPIHNFGIAHMYGAPTQLTPTRNTQDNYDVYADSLDAWAQYFIGSSGNDTYSGTTHDDKIVGNGGDDTFSTGGGYDLIKGGAGWDTLVLSGNQADYSVVKTAAGYTILDQRTGELAVDGMADLSSVETLQFADGDLSTRGLTSHNMITIDASALSEVNFNSYLQDYFASFTSGAYKFYGGTLDSGRFYLNGTQIAYEYTENGTAQPDRFIMGGENLAYDYFHSGAQYGHGLSGQMDTWTFGQWTASTTGTQGTGPSGAIQGLAQELLISGIDLNVPVGTGTSSIINTLWTAAQARDYATLNSFLDTKAQHFIGTAGDDVYTGTSFGDLIEGGAGDDILDGGAGADIMKGGAGDDTYYVDNARDVVIDTGRSDVNTVFASADYTLGDSAVVSFLTGNGDSLELTGNRFAQTITGTDGNDVLNGGLGRDVLIGGEGEDTFVFDTALRSNIDTIGDFEVGVDSIQLDSAIFSALDAGALDADFFSATGKSTDGDDFIVYNARTGYISYDADGNGSGTAFKFALVDKDLGISASDFVIV